MEFAFIRELGKVAIVMAEAWEIGLRRLDIL